MHRARSRHAASSTGPSPVDDARSRRAGTAILGRMRHQNPWDVREPAAIIIEALRRTRPRTGDVLVAMLDRGDCDEQKVQEVLRVNRGALPQRFDASDQLREHALHLAGRREWLEPGRAPYQGVLVTIACRTGRVVPGPNELFWLMAWRYSNHNTGAYDGDVYLVTDHGWTGCHDHRAGFEPSLRAARTPLSMAPQAFDG